MLTLHTFRLFGKSVRGLSGYRRTRRHNEPPGEERLSEERENQRQRRHESEGREAEKSGKSWWDAEEPDRYQRSSFCPRIASQTLRPRESPMCPLSPCERTAFSGVDTRRGWQISDGDGLCAEQRHPLASRLASVPVFPKKRMRSERERRRNSGFWGWSFERPQHGTDTARLRGEAAFLTLGAQGTGTAMANPSGIQQAYRAIALRPSLLRVEWVMSRTAQRSIGLEDKSSSWKSTSERGACPLRQPIRHRGRFGWSRCTSRRRLGRSEFGGAHGHWMEAMTQFEAQVPYPLAENLPGLLPAGGVGTPTVRVLLFVLIGQYGLESASMQVQLHHIGRGKRVLRQGGEEQLVDDSLAGCSDRTGRG